MDKIEGVVDSVFTSKKEKEGKDGMPTEEDRKQITIKGVGDDEGITVVVQGTPDKVFGFRLDDDVTLKFTRPQQRLTTEPTPTAPPTRRPVE